ncbi:MAG: thioredoxin family protein [Nitriliruptoraceae bacterium]
MDPIVLRALVVGVVVVAVVVAGKRWQSRDGKITLAASSPQPSRHDHRAVPRPSGPRIEARHLDAVGLDLREADAGALLIGSPTCAPCDTVKQVLGDIQQGRSGFRWVYADAADHLELAAEHRIMRVPTVLVVARDGRIVARTSGVPRTDELNAVLDGEFQAAA